MSLKAYREITVYLGGESLTLAATPAAVSEVQRQIADPLMMTRALHLERSAIDARQFDHKPEFQFSTTTIPLILHIGAEHAASELTLDDVTNLTFAAGYAEARERAIEYLCALLTAPRDPAEILITERLAAMSKRH